MRKQNVRCFLERREKEEERKKKALFHVVLVTQTGKHTHTSGFRCVYFFFSLLCTLSRTSLKSLIIFMFLCLCLSLPLLQFSFFFFIHLNTNSLSLSFFFFYVWSRSLTLLLDHFSHIFTIIAFFFFHFKAFFPLLRAYTSFCFFFFFYVVIKSTLF